MSSFLKSKNITYFNYISCFRVLLLVNICIADYGNNIYFELFTRTHRFQRININSGHDNLLETTFNVTKPTKVIVHGYNSDPKAISLVRILNNYLSVYDCNVIMVNWSFHADHMYLKTIGLSRIVAFYVARLFLVLMKHGVQDIHAVGHSLGAHISAIAANYLGNHKLKRITGLDPARPFLGAMELDPSDAEFVDIYHSSILGKANACGHVDFIMNSGRTQPGCLRIDLVCNHARASLYFAESITSWIGFWGYPMNLKDDIAIGKISKVRVLELAGEFVNTSIRGVYYVPTKAREPFAMGPFF